MREGSTTRDDVAVLDMRVVPQEQRQGACGRGGLGDRDRRSLTEFDNRPTQLAPNQAFGDSGDHRDRIGQGQLDPQFVSEAQVSAAQIGVAVDVARQAIVEPVDGAGVGDVVPGNPFSGKLIAQMERAAESAVW